MPENPTPTADPTEVELPSTTDDTVVHVIESSYHYLDRDNRAASDEELLVDEGWFADPAAAAIRCEQLNDKNRSYYEASMATRKRSHDAKIRQAKKANKEAAAIRAAGMPKADVPVPPPFVPDTFEKFFAQSSHTTYGVVEVRRSDHDGISRAGDVDPANADEPTAEDKAERTAAKGAALRTA